MLNKLNAKYVDVGGYRLRYVTEGTGPPVLLIHGFEECSHWLRIEKVGKFSEILIEFLND